MVVAGEDGILLWSDLVVREVGLIHASCFPTVTIVHFIVEVVELGVQLTLPVFLHELYPVEIVFFWAALPLLSSVICLAKVFHLSVVRVFVVKDHGYSALDLGCFDFGGVYVSDVARPFFIFFYCFLGVAHLVLGDPRVVLSCPSLPFD